MALEADTPSESLGPRRRRRRQTYALISIIAVLVVLFMLGFAFLFSWAPLIHQTCARGGQVASLTDYYVPAVLVNSPYGGRAWANGTVPVTFPGAWNGPPDAVTAVAFGTGAFQGSAFGAFFTVNVSVYQLENSTEWGPGTNNRCSSAFGLGFQAPSRYAEAGTEIMGGNNTSDLNEPHFGVIYQGTENAVDTLLFDNSFHASNRNNVTTCNGPAQSVPRVLAFSLQVWFPVSIGGRNQTIPYTFTFPLTFHYWFPADFGTWQIDNLSAPGGPGGGWAFSYLGSCT